MSIAAPLLPGDVPLLHRALAKAVDLALLVLLSVLLPHPAGVFLGLIYVIVQDGLPGAQSVGKRLFKLRVVMFSGVGDGGLGPQKPCDLTRSAIRNAPLAVATFFAIIPLWGWALAILVGVPMLAMELYLMVTRTHRTRLGDVMADTRVISSRG